MALRHVDATKHRGAIYRGWVRATSTRPARWLSRTVAWKVDPVLMRWTGGRLGFGIGLPTAVLETTGARSGQARRNAVLYFHDGDQVVLVASKMGLPEHPAWFHNAVAHPDVVLGGDPFRVEVVTDEDQRFRLWVLADHVFPGFAVYRDLAAQTGRTIPLLRLTARSVPR